MFPQELYSEPMILASGMMLDDIRRALRETAFNSEEQLIAPNVNSVSGILNEKDPAYIIADEHAPVGGAMRLLDILRAHEEKNGIPPFAQLPVIVVSEKPNQSTSNVINGMNNAAYLDIPIGDASLNNAILSLMHGTVDSFNHTLTSFGDVLSDSIDEFDPKFVNDIVREFFDSTFGFRPLIYTQDYEKGDFYRGGFKFNRRELIADGFDIYKIASRTDPDKILLYLTMKNDAPRTKREEAFLNYLFSHQETMKYLSRAYTTSMKISEFQAQSEQDTMTGLGNEKGFKKKFAEYLGAASRAIYSNKSDTPLEVPVTAYIMDVNGLKSVNDTYGHQAGNRVIKYVAELISQELRKTNYPVRLHGDEFAMLDIFGNDPEAFKQILLERFNDKSLILKNLKTGVDEQVDVRIAVGYSTRTFTERNLPNERTIREMYAEADKQMYLNKALQTGNASAKLASSSSVHSNDQKQDGVRVI
ncbi:GGDEF domain-containing protein [Nanoarchaeota archaeon]